MGVEHTLLWVKLLTHRLKGRPGGIKIGQLLCGLCVDLTPVGPPAVVTEDRFGISKEGLV